MKPFVVVITVLGLAAGWLLPTLEEQFARYKQQKRQQEWIENRRFTAWYTRFLFALLTGAGFFLGAHFCPSAPQLALFLLIWYLSLCVALLDLRIRIIPNQAVLLFAALGIAMQVLRGGTTAFFQSLIAMIVILLAFTAAGLFLGLGKVGAGDVKLAGAMGLVCGFPYIFQALIGFAAALSIFCLIGLISRRLNRKTMIPLAPFLIFGQLFSLICQILSVSV